MQDGSEDSQFLMHIACDNCGSSDGNSLYSDGHQFCYACDAYVRGEGDPSPASHTHKRGRKMSADLIDGEIRALKARGITEDTCRRYGYRVGKYSGKACHIAPYFDANGNEIGQKLRFADKDEGMPWVGESKKPRLFGQQLPLKSTKKLVVTEGEIDCLTMSQVQGNKWPVVSVPLGAKAAKDAFKRELEWISQFDEVILMFDMDEPGQEAAIECARLLPPRKVKIATLPMKDPNEMMVAGRSSELIDAMWSAQPYRPDGILSGSAILSRLKNRPTVTSYPYPEDIMPSFNQKTYGIRLGELDVWTSGTGMGKTTVIKQLQWHFWKTTPYNQAIIHLEEPLEDSADGLISLHLGKRLALPDVRASIDETQIDAAALEIFESKDDQGEHRLHLYDAFGSLDEDDLYSKIRYFVQGLGCKIIWLDHLSILVSDSDERSDERRLIDSIMHNLKSLTVELNCYIGLISHLKKAPTGKSFEQGYTPSLDDLRGSGGIKQLANSVFALSRDQQHPTEIGRNMSLITVLKCRYTGRTGPADWLHFNDQTGRMEKGFDPAAIMEDESDTPGAFVQGDDRDDIPF